METDGLIRRTVHSSGGLIRGVRTNGEIRESQSDFQKVPELNKQIYKKDMHILHNYEKYLGIIRRESSKIAIKVALNVQITCACIARSRNKPLYQITCTNAKYCTCTNLLRPPEVSRNWGKQRLAYQAITDWNNLNRKIKLSRL